MGAFGCFLLIADAKVALVAHELGFKSSIIVIANRYGAKRSQDFLEILLCLVVS
jgi:hypothetical protein